ncbi:hypothetical protein GQE99_04345 [Maritimibacter sp. DP07]|uniref:HTH LytTR-type domain-containing protein n=1 Tax=Maritimibacter harenae TaxID=2606218 RepID=A0A845LWC2_9RHOB|nr:LytTR family DNA-binding domain-containing protein [Maritimibacter harenae]MZR12240.1 hypothetical protein [Maritimibacter harenae]
MRVEIGRKVAVVLVLLVVATVNGPVGTFDSMTLLERFIYWGLLLPVVSTLMIVGIHYANDGPHLRRLHPLLRITIGAVVAGLPSALWVMTLGATLRGFEFTAYGVGFRWVIATIMGMGIGVIEAYVRPRDIERHMRERLADATPEPAPEPVREDPLFIRNLSPDLGREIISISTRDHYLDVVTAEGKDRILKRMSDAVAELNGLPGLQIHRSHWVALDAVERLEREGRKARVVLKNGATLPVSRPNIPALAEALEKR